MSLSVPELDVATKQFFEGRGEVVCSREASAPAVWMLMATAAKASPEHVESGICSKLPTHAPAKLTSFLVQRESRRLATGGQDPAGS